MRSAQAEGRKFVPVDWVDVDDKRAVKIMSVDNAAAKKGRIAPDVMASRLVDLDDTGVTVTDTELARMVNPTGSGSGSDNNDDLTT